jgi:hypothetical protein
MTLDFLPWGDAVGFLGSERVGSPPVLPLCQIRDNLSGICNRRCCASTSVVCSTSPGPCRSPGPLVYLADGEVTRGMIPLTIVQSLGIGLRLQAAQQRNDHLLLLVTDLRFVACMFLKQRQRCFPILFECPLCSPINVPPKTSPRRDFHVALQPPYAMASSRIDSFPPWPPANLSPRIPPLLSSSDR